MAIFCDVEQGQCSKQVDIVLRLGNRDLAVQTVAVPDEDNFYAFEFFVNDDEIPEGEAFGVRLTFQKPQSTIGWIYAVSRQWECIHGHPRFTALRTNCSRFGW